MKVTVRTDKEISELNLWPIGEYDFECYQALDKISKVKPDGSGGNEMIELKLKVFSPEGKEKLIDDYLIDIPSMAFKIKHASDACGVLTSYEGGALAASDFVGKCGKLKLKIQKDKTGTYPDKNVVGDYLVKKDGEEGHSHVPAQTGTPIDQDACPF